MESKIGQNILKKKVEKQKGKIGAGWFDLELFFFFVFLFPVVLMAE